MCGVQIHDTQEGAEAAAADTRAADALEFDYAAALDFGGLSTTTVSQQPQLTPVVYGMVHTWCILCSYSCSMLSIAC